MLKQDDLPETMKTFCERARLVSQHTSAVVGVLTVADPVNAAAPIRPSADTLCIDVEFEPPDEDTDFL